MELILHFVWVFLLIQLLIVIRDSWHLPCMIYRNNYNTKVTNSNLTTKYIVFMRSRKQIPRCESNKNKCLMMFVIAIFALVMTICLHGFSNCRENFTWTLFFLQLSVMINVINIILSLVEKKFAFLSTYNVLLIISASIFATIIIFTTNVGVWQWCV